MKTWIIQDWAGNVLTEEGTFGPQAWVTPREFNDQDDAFDALDEVRGEEQADDFIVSLKSNLMSA